MSLRIYYGAPSIRCTWGIWQSREPPGTNCRWPCACCRQAIRRTVRCPALPPSSAAPCCRWPSATNRACCWTVVNWTVPRAIPVVRPTPSIPCASCVASWAQAGHWPGWWAPTACWACPAGTNGRPCSGWPTSWWPSGRAARCRRRSTVNWGVPCRALGRQRTGPVRQPGRAHPAPAPPAARGIGQRRALADRRRWPLARPAAAGRRGLRRCTRAVPPGHSVNGAAVPSPYNRPHVYRVDPL